MEALLVMFMPLAILAVGYALITGRSLSPEAVMGRCTTLMWRLLRWLWRDRTQRSGAGRVKHPRMRYHQRP